MKTPRLSHGLADNGKDDIALLSNCRYRYGFTAILQMMVFNVTILTIHRKNRMMRDTLTTMLDEMLVETAG